MSPLSRPGHSVTRPPVPPTSSPNDPVTKEYEKVLAKYLTRWFPPKTIPKNRSLIDELGATREQIADLKITLAAFDRRLERFTESSQEGSIRE